MRRIGLIGAETLCSSVYRRLFSVKRFHVCRNMCGPFVW